VYVLLTALATFVCTKSNVFTEVNTLSVVSFFYFIILLVVSLKNINHYTFILPLAILTVPNAINDNFPSIFMSNVGSGYYDVPSFSLFTHIDLYLISGIIRYAKFNLARNQFICFVTTILVLLALSIKWFFTTDVYNIFMGSFQLRYLIFAYLLVYYTRLSENLTILRSSLVFAGFFVLIESVMFTMLRIADGRLTSGNLGVNSLGHFFAAMALLSFFSSNLKLPVRYLFLLLFTAASYFTLTRFSLIALIVSASFILLANNNGAKRILVSFTFILFFCFSLFYTSNTIKSLVTGIVLVSGSFTEPDAIERTKDSSSMITRLILANGTLKMILDNPIAGIGPGAWSFKKEEYSIPYDGLLDPHNDYLNYLVSYGVVIGTALCLIIFIRPVVLYFNSVSSDVTPLVSFLLCFSFSGLTNAVSWKHQICILLYIISLATIRYVKTLNKTFINTQADL